MCRSYKETIYSWKAHAYRMEKLLKRIDECVFVHFEYMAQFFTDRDDILKLLSCYRKDINKELQRPWIGK